MRYQARAPLRIDLAGGWTDVPVFAQAEGGAVLCAAINRYAKGHISHPEGIGALATLRGDRSYVEYSLDLPAGAGLGASAAQTVLWTALVRTTIINDADRREIAEIAASIAGLLGLRGGKQDEYASSLGGILFLTFGSEVSVERLELAREIVDRLRSRLVLVYSGERRNSALIHARVWERYRERERTVVDALRALKRIAVDMRVALLAGDLDGVAHLMGENWHNQKALDATVTTDAIERILATAARHGSIDGKVCGAGGGGCVLLVSADGREAELREAMRRDGARIIDFDFDTYGVHLKKG
ncbi:MAG: GHMP kinase [Chloroflexota bacterium]